MSISAIGSTQSLSGIQNILQSQVSAGAIPASDQSALSSAITDIGSTLKGGNTSTGATPTSMKDQVDSLIDGEVSSGKLTSAQATELKSSFAKVHAHVHHGHGGGGSSLDSLLSTDDGSTDSTTASSTGSTSSTDPLTSLSGDASGLIDGLASFVNSVRSAVSSNGLYGASGGKDGSLGSLLVNNLA